MIYYLTTSSYNYSKKHQDSQNWYISYEDKLLVYRKNYDPYGYTVKTDKINSRTVHWVKEVQKLY